jgi:crotonobetainyl-CoA:carnitine CoA-transferase CaiB-like acyl-CoA transferase
VTGFYTAYGVLAALYEREKTGTGRKVETSMFEAMSHFNLDDFTHYLSVDEVMGPNSRPHVSQSYVFQCADGGWVALHMSSPPKFWENLATAVGQPDMLARPEFESRPARIANYEKVVDFLAPIFATQPRAYWEERLTSLEVPHSAVYTSKEVVEGDLAAHHGLVVEGQGPRGTFRTIRNPIRFDDEVQQSVTPPPELGADNADILGRD